MQGKSTAAVLLLAAGLTGVVDAGVLDYIWNPWGSSEVMSAESTVSASAEDDFIHIGDTDTKAVSSQSQSQVQVKLALADEASTTEQAPVSESALQSVTQSDAEQSESVSSEELVVAASCLVGGQIITDPFICAVVENADQLLPLLENDVELMAAEDHVELQDLVAVLAQLELAAAADGEQSVAAPSSSGDLRHDGSAAPTIGSTGKPANHRKNQRRRERRKRVAKLAEENLFLNRIDVEALLADAEALEMTKPLPDSTHDHHNAVDDDETLLDTPTDDFILLLDETKIADEIFDSKGDHNTLRRSDRLRKETQVTGKKRDRADRGAPHGRRSDSNHY